MSRASETAKGAAITACGRSTAEGLEGGKICSAAPARRPPARPGKFFRRTGWKRGLRYLALQRHAGTGVQKHPDRDGDAAIHPEHLHPASNSAGTALQSSRGEVESYLATTRADNAGSLDADRRCCERGPVGRHWSGRGLPGLIAGAMRTERGLLGNARDASRGEPVD
jgi:hypothetical protein